MQIIPAVDLMDGRAVRLRQGRKTERTEYFDDPVEPAVGFMNAGAELLHVVDLDGAFGGESKNIGSVRRILEAVGRGIKIELGGGIRTLEQIEAALELGLERVVLGTAILEEPELLSAAVQRFGPRRIVAGLDARNGRIAIRGWEEVTGRDALEIARRVKEQGAERVIYTDIATDGMLVGPNLEALGMMASTGLAVIASGGIARLEHVRKVAEMERLGVEGMIIGRALYEGTVDLGEALKAAGGNSGEPD